MTVRLATAEDGYKIAALLKLNGWGAEIGELDWRDLGPYWLVADGKDRLAACVQLCWSKPIARVEMMAFDPDLTKQERGRLTRDLAYAAMRTIALDGIQAVMFVVPFDLQSYKRLLKRRGAVTVHSGNVLFKRL